MAIDTVFIEDIEIINLLVVHIKMEEAGLIKNCHLKELLIHLVK